MSSSLEKTTVYVDAETRRALRALARASGRPQAELIREALETYLDRVPTQPLPSWVGAWKNGPATDATEVTRGTRGGSAADVGAPGR